MQYGVVLDTTVRSLDHLLRKQTFLDRKDRQTTILPEPLTMNYGEGGLQLNRQHEQLQLPRADSCSLP